MKIETQLRKPNEQQKILLKPTLLHQSTKEQLREPIQKNIRLGSSPQTNNNNPIALLNNVANITMAQGSKSRPETIFYPQIFIHKKIPF